MLDATRRTTEPTPPMALLVRYAALVAYLLHVGLVASLVQSNGLLGVAAVGFRALGSYAWLYERVARVWGSRLASRDVDDRLVPDWVPLVTGLWGHIVWGAMLLAAVRARGGRLGLAIALSAFIGERGIPIPACYFLTRIAAQCDRHAAVALVDGRHADAARLAHLADEARQAGGALLPLAYPPQRGS